MSTFNFYANDNRNTAISKLALENVNIGYCYRRSENFNFGLCNLEFLYPEIIITVS